MNDTAFIFSTISITTALTYFLYKTMLGSDKENKEEELQITPEELVEQLKILNKQKKYNIVQSLAKSYLEKKSLNDDVRRIYAKSLYECKKFYEAIDQAKVVLNHNYNDLEIRIFLANCYEDVDKTQEAISLLLEILEHNPENFLAIKNLARIYFENNQKISALKMYYRLQEFLDSNQEKIKNITTIAEIHETLREYDLAIDSYREILEIYPDDVGVKKKLVDLYRQVADNDLFIELATEIQNSALSAEDVLWAMKKLLDYFISENSYDEALEMARAISENSLADKIEAGEDIAKILLAKDLLDESIELLTSLIEMDSTNIQLKKDLARAYEKKEDFESAVSVYKKILDEVGHRQIQQVHIEMSDIYANWAIYLFEHDDNDACFKQFIIALQYYNQNPEIYFKLGNVNKAIKNFNEAISQYKKAIELNPTNADFYYAIAECYEAIDSVYDQKRNLSDSLKYSSDNPLVHYKLSLIHQHQGDLMSAISYMKKAVELDANYEDAMFKLALMYEHNGEAKKAIELYEAILSVNPDDESVLSCLNMLRD